MFEPYFESIHDDPTLFPHGFHMGPTEFSHFVGTPSCGSAPSRGSAPGCIPDVWNLSSEDSTGRRDRHGQIHSVFLWNCVFVPAFAPG